MTDSEKKKLEDAIANGQITIPEDDKVPDKAKDSVVKAIETVEGLIAEVLVRHRIGTPHETRSYRRQAVDALERLRQQIITSGMGSGNHIGLTKGLIVGVLGTPIDKKMDELRAAGIE